MPSAAPPSGCSAVAAAAWATLSAARPSSMRAFSRTCTGRAGGGQTVSGGSRAAGVRWQLQGWGRTAAGPTCHASAEQSRDSVLPEPTGGGDGRVGVVNGCAGPHTVTSPHTCMAGSLPQRRTSGRLQQRVVPALQRGDDFGHEAKLGAVGLVREVHLAPANGVAGRHGGRPTVGHGRGELAPADGPQKRGPGVGLGRSRTDLCALLRSLASVGHACGREERGLGSTAGQPSVVAKRACRYSRAIFWPLRACDRAEAAGHSRA